MVITPWLLLLSSFLFWGKMTAKTHWGILLHDDRCQKNDYFQFPAVLGAGDIHSPSSCLFICQQSLHDHLWASSKTGRGSSSCAQRSELPVTLTQCAMETLRFPPSSWNHGLLDSYPLWILQEKIQTSWWSATCFCFDFKSNNRSKGSNFK